jgi:group I intron endonuclease
MYIYKITCLKTSESYVGQTINPIELRFKQHIRKAYKNSRSWGICPKLHNAIRKYGQDNFSITCLDTATSREELNKKEAYWISKLNTIEQGYNMCDGGDFGALSAEAREKISRSKKGNQARKGYRNSDGNRCKSSIRMTISNPMKGKPSPCRRKVLCLNNGITYESVRKASDELNATYANIFKHLNGERTHVNGYKFQEIK